MHDPHTVAFEIKYPWYTHRPWPRKKMPRERDKWSMDRAFKELDGTGSYSRMWPDGYRERFITIWHVDPESDGTDDSCGWSYPKLSPEQRERLRNTAWWEGRDPHFLICNSKEWDSPIETAECLYRGMIALVCRVLDIKMTTDEITRHAIESMHIRTGGMAGSVFCFLAGYHTNSDKDSEEDRADHFYGILCGAARGILDRNRPWYKHPKWHFWHWEFQCHPLAHFKRWAFSRCSKCGGRFKYGESPTTNSWNSTGPRWFASETDVFHGSCDGVSVDGSAEKAQ